MGCYRGTSYSVVNDLGTLAVNIPDRSPVSLAVFTCPACNPRIARKFPFAKCNPTIPHVFHSPLLQTVSTTYALFHKNFLYRCGNLLWKSDGECFQALALILAILRIAAGRCGFASRSDCQANCKLRVHLPLTLHSNRMPHLGVLNHPQRDRILQMILEGISDNKIARTVDPKLHRATVGRWRRHVAQQALQPVQAVTKSLQDKGLLVDNVSQDDLRDVEAEVSTKFTLARPFLARLAKYDEIEEKGVRQAGAAQDFKGLSNMLNSATKRVEVAAKLAGVIDSGGMSVAIDARCITVVVPNGSED